MKFNKVVSELLDSKELKDKLPRVPSEILRVALYDLEMARKNKKVKIDMGSWVEDYIGDGSCTVCHAGAVMIGETLGVRDPLKGLHATNPEDMFRNREISENDYKALTFINEVREGYLGIALRNLFSNELSNASISYKDLESFVEIYEAGYGGVNQLVAYSVDADVPLSVSLFFKGYEKDYTNYIEGVIGILEAEGL